MQLAAPALLEGRGEFQGAVRERLRVNRAALLAARAPDAPWDVLRAEGGWSEVLSVPRSRSEEEWALALLRQGVLVHPGYFFDFPSGAHLVISLLPDPQAFRRGVALVADALHAGR